MKVFRDLEHITIRRPVATIGIFDGVHLAHQAVIVKLRQMASELDGETTIITLWPHPRIVLEKESDTLYLLNTLEEKIQRLENAGVENLVIIPFDKKFAETDFSVFVEKTLVGRIGISHLVVGFNHQFGKNREGNFEKLQKLADTFGFGLSRQDPVLVGSEKVSSSTIRKYIHTGEIRRANQYLGYNYRIHGTVVGGDRIGREMGFPTANIRVSSPHKLIPGMGVYAVFARTREKAYKAMMNIGCRPTINKECTEYFLEAHLLEFKGNLYDQEIEIEFIRRVRDEKKFDSREQLKQQIESDRELIGKILDSHNFEPDILG